MLETMKKVKEILDKLEIESWLDCGTLLKMYRDQLPDITDCDMGIHTKDTNKLFQNLDKFELHDFKFKNTFSYPKQGLTELSFTHGRYEIDIFSKFFKGKHAYHVSTYDYKPIVAKFDKHHFDKLVDYSCDGNPSMGDKYYWKIPNDVENYLESYYGKDWRIPNHLWKWSDVPSIDPHWRIE